MRCLTCIRSFGSCATIAVALHGITYRWARTHRNPSFCPMSPCALRAPHYCTRSESQASTNLPTHHSLTSTTRPDKRRHTLEPTLVCQVNWRTHAACCRRCVHSHTECAVWRSREEYRQNAYSRQPSSLSAFVRAYVPAFASAHQGTVPVNVSAASFIATSTTNASAVISLSSGQGWMRARKQALEINCHSIEIQFNSIHVRSCLSDCTWC